MRENTKRLPRDEKENFTMSAEAWPFGAIPPGYVAALKFSVSVANTAEKPHKY